jgi:3-isopropylmalate dehydratase small subunit
VTLEPSDLALLMDTVELDPGQEVVIDLEARTVTSRAGTMAAGIRDGTRKQLLDGTWNATAVLMEAGDAIERTAEQLPYLNGKWGRC